MRHISCRNTATRDAEARSKREAKAKTEGEWQSPGFVVHSRNMH